MPYYHYLDNVRFEASYAFAFKNSMLLEFLVKLVILNLEPFLIMFFTL